MASSGENSAETLSDHTTRHYQNRQSRLEEYSQCKSLPEQLGGDKATTRGENKKRSPELTDRSMGRLR
jgi:hypothetical protein